MAKAGILCVRRVKESDLTKLAKASGARIVTNLDDLFEKDLGTANLVEERKIEEDRWVFIEGCKHPKSVTLLLRAGSQRVVDELERSVHDALMVFSMLFSSSRNDFRCWGFEILILASVSVLLISNAVLISAILAWFTFFGIPE